VIIFIFDLVTERKCDVLSLIAKITKILKIGLCDFLQAKFWRNQRLYNEGAKAVRIVRCEPHCLSRQAWFTSWKLMKNKQTGFPIKKFPEPQTGKEGPIPREPNHCGGRRKVPTMLQVLSSTARLLPEDFRVEHGGVKLTSCTGRHLTSLQPSRYPLISSVSMLKVMKISSLQL